MMIVYSVERWESDGYSNKYRPVTNLNDPFYNELYGSKESLVKMFNAMFGEDPYFLPERWSDDLMVMLEHPEDENVGFVIRQRIVN